MEIATQVIIASTAIISALVGAISQYYFSKLNQKESHLSDLRTNAYIDYLLSVSEIVRANKEERNRILSDCAYAKTRIVLYGTKNVLNALTEFEKSGARLDSEKQIELFVNICECMRQENQKIDPALYRDQVCSILFPNKLPQ